MVFIVILAGGGGERLWPKSRKNLPKQCISLDGKQTLIQKTYEIASQIVGEENIIISTRRELASIIQEQLPSARLLVEPLGRDSAAGIGFACLKLLYEKIDEVTVFMGADYHIPDTNAFQQTLNSALQWAEKGKIVTIGIKPTRIETRFGYIKPGKLLSQAKTDVYKVESFREKPDKILAQEYISKGYLWNSGMFIVKPSTLYQNIKRYMPTLFQALERIRDSNFDENEKYNAFFNLPKISIDYGIMEKTAELVVVKGEFAWDDIGTFDSLKLILDPDSNGNIIQGEFLGIDVENSIILNDKPVIALGISDLVVVDTSDCVFICSRDRAGEIKEILVELEKNDQLKRLIYF
ncbi:MAG: mannose-1-phosphate guanylyltransferase [Candidatus Hodarchaeota archaeon]